MNERHLALCGWGFVEVQVETNEYAVRFRATRPE
jgi:hypothetical protein